MSTSRLAALVGCAGLVCLSAPQVLAQPAPSAAVRVVNASGLTKPARGALTEETVHQGQKMVTRIMRIAPGGKIAEHHHPYFEETFVVQAGSVALQLNGAPHALKAGDVAYIPSGTVIAGQNLSDSEATVIVTWANNGQAGPLTVPGKPAQH